MLKIPNLFMKQGNGAVITPQHMEFTTSDDLYVVWSKSLKKGTDICLSTSLSRGCPKQCRFCTVGLYHGRSFRVPSVQKVIECLLAFLKNSGCSRQDRLRINFEDDNLLLDPGYFLNVLRSIRDAAGVDVSFYAENGIDYMLLTPDLANKLIDAGMRQFNLSLASTDLTVLRKQGRGLDLKRYEGIIKAISQRSIPSITYFICGFKEDTKEGIAQNLAYLAMQDTLLGISVCYPVPGAMGVDAADSTITSMQFPAYLATNESGFDAQPFKPHPATKKPAYLAMNESCFDAVDPTTMGMPLSPRLSAGSSAYPWSGSLSTSTLVTAFRLSRYVNLIKNRHKTEMEYRLCDRIAATRRLHTIIKEKGAVRIIEMPGMDNDLVSLFFILTHALE